MLLTDDRYTVPEYNKIHEYVASGDMWNTVMKEHDRFVAENTAMKSKRNLAKY